MVEEQLSVVVFIMFAIYKEAAHHLEVTGWQNPVTDKDSVLNGIVVRLIVEARLNWLRG